MTSRIGDTDLVPGSMLMVTACLRTLPAPHSCPLWSLWGCATSALRGQSLDRAVSGKPNEARVPNADGNPGCVEESTGRASDELAR